MLAGRNFAKHTHTVKDNREGAVGMLDRTGAEIRVGVDLRSGETMDFAIDEPTFQVLESLMEEGLRGAELCHEWLGPALPLDRPIGIRVVGHRSDGSAIDLVIRCDDDAPPHESHRNRGTTTS